MERFEAQGRSFNDRCEYEKRSMIFQQRDVWARKFLRKRRSWHVLQRSGLKSYIDTKKRALLAKLNSPALSDSYELLRRAFRLLADLPFEDTVAHRLNNFAFTNGISTDLFRRIAAIYLRDIVAKSH